MAGALALVANSILIIFGREAFLPMPVAGVTGVAAAAAFTGCKARGPGLTGC